LPSVSPKWRETLVRAKTDAAFAELRKELQTLNAPIPEVAAVKGGTAVLAAWNGIVLVAANVQTAERVRAAWPNLATQAQPTGLVRVDQVWSEPATVLSWMTLPLPALPSVGEHSLPAATVSASGVSGALKDGRSPTQDRTAIVLAGRDQGERFVVLRGAAARDPDASEPLYRLAQLRTVAWATGYVAEDGERDVQDADDASLPPPNDEVASPLLTELDLAQQQSASQALGDQIIVALVAGYLFVQALMIWRNAPSRS